METENKIDEMEFQEEGKISEGDLARYPVNPFKLIIMVYGATALIAFVLMAIIHGFRGALDIIDSPDPGRDMLIGAFIGIIVIFVSAVLGHKLPSMKKLETLLKDLVSPFNRLELLWMAVFSGFAEEMFFRGFLQPLTGLIIASVVFGIIHWPMKKEFLAWPVFAVIMGFILGTMMIWTEGLYAPITAHFLINAVNLQLLKKRKE